MEGGEARELQTYVISFIHIQICVHISLVGTPDGASHTRPGLLEGQHALYVVAVDLLARHGVNDGGLNAKEGQRSAAGLGGGDTCQWGDDVGTGLGLPVCLTGNVSIEFPLLGDLLSGDSEAIKLTSTT